MGAIMATTIDVLKGVALLVLIPLGFTFLIVTYRLVRIYYTTGRADYIRNRDRSRSFRNVIRGEVSSFYDGTRDERVSAGIAIDTNKNEWAEQGKLSEEAISSVLH
jgi:hypothetical protein